MVSKTPTLQVGLAEGDRFVKLIHQQTTLTTPDTIGSRVLNVLNPNFSYLYITEL